LIEFAAQAAVNDLFANLDNGATEDRRVNPLEKLHALACDAGQLGYEPLECRVIQCNRSGDFPADVLARVVGAQLLSETLLYLKDGSVFAVATYTVADGVLHYVTSYGEKNDLLIDLLDLQKTIEANAARGVAFTLTPPDPAVHRDSRPTPLGPAPAPEGPITPPRP